MNTSFLWGPLALHLGQDVGLWPNTYQFVSSHENIPELLLS